MHRLVKSILGVYIFSFALTTINKTLFGKLRVPFPFFVTFIHFGLSSVVLKWVTFLKVKPQVDLKVVVPIAILTTLDIGLTNMVYSRVSLPVITVMKSANIVTTYLIGVAFGVEHFSVRLLSVCVLIVTSVAFAVPSAQIYDSLGILMLVIAIMSMSIRWVLIQKLVKDIEPIDLALATMPLSSLGFLFMSICFEREILINWITEKLEWFPVIIIFTSCVCAFSLLYFEFLTVKFASSLTLLLSGACKEISILIASAVMFDEFLSVINWIAIAVSLYGIVLYWKLRSAQPLYHQIHQPCELTQAIPHAALGE